MRSRLVSSCLPSFGAASLAITVEVCRLVTRQQKVHLDSSLFVSLDDRIQLLLRARTSLHAAVDALLSNAMVEAELFKPAEAAVVGEEVEEVGGASHLEFVDLGKIRRLELELG